MNDALLLQSVDALVACKDLGELAARVAQLARSWLESAEVLVLLRSPDGEFTSDESGVGQPDAASGLRAWAEQRLAEPATGLCRADRHVAARIEAARIEGAGVQIHGVLAVALPQSGSDEERLALLGALATLAGTCSAQIQRRILADRALQDTRALVARGLHDLCTPLNSLRLGMHLLEPALTTKDPAIAQRAHRAVDRMALLVSTMADAIHKAKAADNLQA